MIKTIMISNITASIRDHVADGGSLPMHLLINLAISHELEDMDTDFDAEFIAEISDAVCAELIKN